MKIDYFNSFSLLIFRYRYRLHNMLKTPHPKMKNKQVKSVKKTLLLKNHSHFILVIVQTLTSDKT